MKEDEKSLKESIDTLLDENERLRKKIEALEAEKEAGVSNCFPEESGVLSKILREAIADGYQSYLKHLDKSKQTEINNDGSDWSYRPDRDGLDWSYRPHKTTRPFEVGDWPPGPQIGDPSWTPNDYPYYPYYPYGPWWGIYPPYWIMPSREYVVTTTNTGDPVKPYSYTTSGDKEN